MNIFLIIALIITLIYGVLSFIKNNKEIPESISATSYIWEHYCKHNGTLHKANYFSLYCFIIVILLFLPWLLSTIEMWQFLVFLACVGILAAGTTPFFKEKYQSYIHYGGGILAMICFLLWMILMKFYISLLIFGSLYILTLIFNRKNFVFWAELLGLLTLIITLLII